MTGKRTQTSPVGSPSSGNISDGSSKDQDRFLPIANVSRIMKRSLPANAKISKEAKETVQECVSEFISFITGEASDKCQREKRKTINGDDLLWAMTTLGFENYVDTLKTYLNKYREIEGDRTTSMVTSPSMDEISKVITNPTTTTRPAIHGDFSEAYYSIGAQPTPRSYEDGGKIAIGHGDNFMTGAFNIRKMHNIGNANDKRALATHLHQGVEW